MSKEVVDLLQTLQGGLSKIAEIAKAQAKTAAAPVVQPEPAFDRAAALVAATDTCRKLAGFGLMPADAVESNAAALVSNHGDALTMLNEFVGAMRPDSVKQVSKTASLGTVTGTRPLQDAQPARPALRC